MRRVETVIFFTFKELIKELIKGNFSEVFHECSADVTGQPVW